MQKRSKPTKSLKSKALITNWSNTDLVDFVESKLSFVLVPRDLRVLKDSIFGATPTIFSREQILAKARELYELSGITPTV